MSRFLCISFLLALFSMAIPSSADDIRTVKSDDEAVWRTGAGAYDGAYTSSVMSMLGWGLGLTAGIGILVSVLHQSTPSTSSGHCH